MIQLSSSALGILEDAEKPCPKCFWLDRRFKLSRPRGIFSSMPIGIDGLMKARMDSFRKKGEMPPELKVPELEGFRLFDNQKLLDQWRNWKTGLRYEGFLFPLVYGFDDVLIFEREGHQPVYTTLDYKTKGKCPEQADCVKYYQRQADLGSLVLQENDYPSLGTGFLLYLYPKHTDKLDYNVEFDTKVISLDVNIDRGKALVEKACNILESNVMPDPGPKCEYCNFIYDRKNFVAPDPATKFVPEEE